MNEFYIYIAVTNQALVSEFASLNNQRASKEIEILFMVSNIFCLERRINTLTTANFYTWVQHFTSKWYINDWKLLCALHRNISHTATGVIVLVRNFHSGLENAANSLLLCYRNNAQDIAKRRSNFQANFLQTFAETKNEIRTFLEESFNFGTCYQKQDKFISDFIVALKELSIHFNYGEFLNWALRDGFEESQNTE